MDVKWDLVGFICASQVAYDLVCTEVVFCKAEMSGQGRRREDNASDI
jgi:hypothetical protein